MMNFQFDSNASGQWELVLNGERYVGVVAIRAFPVAAPDEAISIVDDHGHELVWIAQLADLSDALRTRVRQALTEREFMPLIQKLHGVSSFATPSTWDIETDRGPTQLVLKGEEDIRRLSASVLLVTDTQGVQYLIRDLHLMDRHSRKLLDRFL
jgi:hypothetical protein